MSRRHPRLRKESPSNDRIARLWRDSLEEHDPDSAVRFEAAIDALLQTGKLNVDRIGKIINRIEPAGVMDFMVALDDVAARFAIDIRGHHGPIRSIEMFGLPVFGNLDLAAGIIGRDALPATLARLVRETGWSAEKSGVFIHPQILSPAAFMALDPMTIRGILLDTGYGPYGEHSRSALMAALADTFGPSPASEGMVQAGAGFLVGVRYMDDDNQQFDALWPEVDEDTADERMELAEGAWHEEMSRLFGEDSEIAILPPVPWRHLRAEFLLSAFDGALSMALIESGEDLDTFDRTRLDAVMARDPDGIRVDVRKNGESVMSYAIAATIMGHALEEFVCNLAADMPVTLADDEPAASPTIH
ncbi:hypothetical protein LAZ40_07170 [Cereibacter sphaeroides]|uniref:hypothetical protein n=1 Tax=Cereibacter sphaeroides TaxID=1063 RepID=UPI001F1F8697|nr:hypothetical protein [Cereibacter sphaeroides]MCE6958828.1 hypothetical protein [Cereibacter sphaeroides]MCE6973298.1 hypothetical protein [Cereibacter sphaeroides]